MEQPKIVLVRLQLLEIVVVVFLEVKQVMQLQQIAIVLEQLMKIVVEFSEDLPVIVPL